ncbi:mitochondrial intermembrane space import and assembly protein 40-B-like isoform X1 [Trichogramma pretiosum]|uniref:mitochondrial intermembrane space import and assembly protein 40-B-like isoform X1 n=1 Tax=Trichogramma pretiosum TaxID=7493 RepID=UPI0006C9D0C6|nr:mitochondrial intermembrane space import and assembly protein 40-B-like isoform X1 [Trichogramma pretiosum]
MSTVKKLGKDTVILATKEDHAVSELEPPSGVVLPNGEINWDCPCLGGVPNGPCGTEFREAFSCFINSTNESKGSECVDAFNAMMGCMGKYPELYSNKSTDMNEDFEEDTTKGIDKQTVLTNSNETENVLNTSMKNESTETEKTVSKES